MLDSHVQHRTATVPRPYLQEPVLKWFLKATLQYSRGQIMWLWIWCVNRVWVVYGWHGVALSGSAFSGCHAEFYEDHGLITAQLHSGPVWVN